MPCVVAKAIVARVRSKLTFWFYFETNNVVDEKKRSVLLPETDYYTRDGVTRLTNKLEQYLQKQHVRRALQTAQEQEQEQQQEAGRTGEDEDSRAGGRCLRTRQVEAVRSRPSNELCDARSTSYQSLCSLSSPPLAAASASRVRALGAGLRHARDWEAKARRKADCAIDSRLAALQSLPSSSWLLIGLLHVSGGMFQCH